jgi:hypothetical protein
VGEPALDYARIAAQARSAAHAFCVGLDGTELVPVEIRDQVRQWRQRLERRGEQLDLEGWLLGLLTLACISRSDLSAPGHISVRGFSTADATDQPR